MTPNIEQTIVEIARVSSSRKDKTENQAGLINYLIKNNHWSPFEHGFITFEIETSKAIGIQLLRHRSFTFQELSQRYADISKMIADNMFESIELRRQADDNRQSSEDIIDGNDLELYSEYDAVYMGAEQVIDSFLERVKTMYEHLLKQGVARECARMILPMATKTTIFMTGPVRSWIHMLDIRDDSHAQKEIQLIAKEIKRQLIEVCPIIAEARGWTNN